MFRRNNPLNLKARYYSWLVRSAARQKKARSMSGNMMMSSSEGIARSHACDSEYDNYMASGNLGPNTENDFSPDNDHRFKVIKCEDSLEGDNQVTHNNLIDKNDTNHYNYASNESLS